MAPPNVESDAKPAWAEPFSAMYWRIRVQTHLLAMAFMVVLVMGYWLFVLGSRASAHVYEIHPNGEATYVGSRESNLAPRPAEAQYVANKFGELLYGSDS